MNKIVIEGESLKDAQRLMKALFGKERSYASYAEMAEAAEKIRSAIDEARTLMVSMYSDANYEKGWVTKEMIQTDKNVRAWLASHPSSLKNEEVLDRDKQKD